MYSESWETVRSVVEARRLYEFLVSHLERETNMHRGIHDCGEHQEKIKALDVWEKYGAIKLVDKLVARIYYL